MGINYLDILSLVGTSHHYFPLKCTNLIASAVVVASNVCQHVFYLCVLDPVNYVEMTKTLIYCILVLQRTS